MTTPFTSSEAAASLSVSNSDLRSGIVHAFSFFSLLKRMMRTPSSSDSFSIGGTFGSLAAVARARTAMWVGGRAIHCDQCATKSLLQ